MSKFGTRLNQLRKSASLSQEEFAKKIGVSRSTIGMYEQGKREPDFETLEKIADYFNVDTDYLLGTSDKTTVIPQSGYYTNPETAAAAQEMFEDPDMKTLYNLKRTMGADRFKAHVKFMKDLYDQEHPESDEGC